MTSQRIVLPAVENVAFDSNPKRKRGRTSCSSVTFRVLFVMLLTVRPVYAEDGRATLIGIQPVSGDSAVNLKWAAYPHDVIYYRTPQQIQIAVPENEKLASWMDLRSSAVFVSIGAERGATKWERRDDDGWRMTMQRPDVYRVRVDLVPGTDNIAVEMALTNLSDRHWKDGYVNLCCRLLRAPGFFDERGDRTIVCFADRPRRMTETTRVLPADPTAAGQYYRLPGRFMGVAYGLHLVDVGGVCPERVINGLVVRLGRDNQSLIATCWKDAHHIWCGTASEREHCIHSDPYFGDLAPGVTVVGRGHVYLMQAVLSTAIQRAAREDGIKLPKQIGISTAGPGHRPSYVWPSSVKENPYVRIVDRTLVCNTPGRRHRAFPTAARLPNGDILVGFRVGTDHHQTLDGAFYTTRSSDGGRTWSTPVCLSSEPGWDVCANIGQYANGVLPANEPYLHTIIRKYRWVKFPKPGRNWREAVSYVTISRDLGHNWEPPHPLFDESIVEVETERGPMKLHSFSPHSYNSTLHRLKDGTIMGLFWGRSHVYPYFSYHWKNRSEKSIEQAAETIKELETGTPGDWALAGFSKDNMRPWTFRVVSAPKDGIGLSESDAVRLSTGRFVAIYGNNAGTQHFYETHSDDEGQTWSPRRKLNFQGDSPSMILLKNDVILAATRSGDRHGTSLVASPDGGTTWDYLGNVDDTPGENGYPDLVRLADGRILCVYYTGHTNIRGVFLKELQ